jgi:broad specificity phosphatase PhoE
MDQPQPSGTLHLVRHGRVENPTGIIYGRLPGFSLSELGARQAAAAAEHLSGVDLGAIICSPMERAQETAGPIAARHGLEVVIDDRLLESDTTFEGVTRTLWKLLRNPRRVWQLRNPWLPTWGESFAQVRARMLEAVTDALISAGGRNVALVSHQTPIQVTRLALERRTTPPWLAGIPCHTGSVTTMVLKEGRVVSTSYFSPPF